MTDVELRLQTLPVGTVYRHASSSGERISFRYADHWLASPERFAIDPELFLDARATAPARGGLFGAFSDCAPDRWGRQLMQRKERRAAESEMRAVRTLSELDYVLGVSDESRQGALRFLVGDRYLAPDRGLPPLVRLGSLLEATRRLERDEDSDEDLALLVAPGSSLGGARPKASVLDQHGRLSIAKFPREADEYSVERWEWVALKLGEVAGLQIPEVELLEVAGRQVLLSRRFDRLGEQRVHFASALTLLGLRDGDRASYPELAEILQREGSQPRSDCEQLFRRMVFNICVANVDDHLRNHGFLRDPKGWKLSPAYDLNPVPTDVRPRVLSTNVTLDDATGSLSAARQSATYFGLSSRRAEQIISEVELAIADWRTIAQGAGASARECRRMQSAFLSSSASS
jgi:serine/threonine-protein kinase HipA